MGKAAALGLTSHAIPVEYGGGGVAAVTSSLIAEELSWGCAGLSAPIGATMFPVRPLLRSGTAEQKERWLTRLASEEGCLAAIAFTEPGAGSDVAAIQSTARRDGDEYVLERREVLRHERWHRRADDRLRESSTARSRPSSSRTATPAWSAGRKEDKLGLRASYTGSIILEDARIPAERRLGEEGQGLQIALDFFEASRPQVAAGGGRSRARRLRVRGRVRARSREAFGKRIMDKQGISFKLADMAMEIEAARLLVWRACDAVRLRGRDAGLLGSYAKAFAADAAMRATTEAVQILGGAGVMSDHPVEKWFRDAKVFQIVEGTSRDPAAGDRRRVPETRPAGAGCSPQGQLGLSLPIERVASLRPPQRSPMVVSAGA